MLSRHWEFAGLLGVAGVAFWLLLAGPSTLLGIDTGQAGTALLATVAWVSMYAVSRLPRAELGKTASPGEWKAWIGTGFMVVAIGYFLARMHVFQGPEAFQSPEASAVGRNLVLLLVAWTVLSSVLGSRFKDEVQQDERDREIEKHASGWGRTALIVFVIGLALMLGFSPGIKLHWATHFMIANLLIAGVMVSCLFECAATVVHYWRDRH
ncbi:MAG: hypothetical protein WKF61_08610 [Luteimonas sp.]